MRQLESVLSKNQKTPPSCCKFKNICPYFTPENYTCANDGGSHCGKYRKLETEKIKEQKL